MKKRFKQFPKFNHKTHFDISIAQKRKYGIKLYGWNFSPFKKCFHHSKGVNPIHQNCSNISFMPIFVAQHLCRILS